MFVCLLFVLRNGEPWHTSTALQTSFVKSHSEGRLASEMFVTKGFGCLKKKDELTYDKPLFAFIDVSVLLTNELCMFKNSVTFASAVSKKKKNKC